MDEQAMLTRDLVLRLCADPIDFDEEWLRSDGKITVPFTAPRDTSLIDTIVAAGRAMGVDHLLICRTRNEFAFEPVTDVPADTASIVAVIRGWGDEPTDLVVAVEDLSAAVLVTASELTVAAGPDDFLRPFVGRDLAGARTAFAEEARKDRDPRLLRAAQRYGCIDQGHATAARAPGPDLAERVAVRARRLRESADRTVAWMRALRGAWGWAMVAVLLAAALIVPGISASLPVLAGTLWLMAQFAWFARSRTVGFATLMRVVALGALMIWPAALAGRLLAGALGDVEAWVGPTYIAVLVEEPMKLLPLLLCRMVAGRRFRRLAAVDYLLLAAASGAGFHLAEQALRAATGGAGPAPVYGVLTLFPGWTELPGLGIQFSGHAVTTGLIGAALGLAIVGHRHYGARLWILPPLALWVAALEHMTFNAAIAGVDPTPVTAVLAALTGGGAATRWILLALLVAAVLLDHRLAGAAADTTPALPGEPPLAGLRRWARGRSVRIRVRVPGDIAPVFRRAAYSWALLPVTLVTALSAILHEFAVMLAAAARGPATLCTTWDFLRQRRAYAMGAARAGDRPWRRFPRREDLAASARSLRAALAPAPASLSVAAAASVLVALHPHVGSGYLGGEWAAVPESGGGFGYAVAVLGDAATWLGALSPVQQAWAWAAVAAFVSLLVSGWAVPRVHPTVGDVLRRPGHSITLLLGACAPGQTPYAITAVAGLALPRSTDRLLRG
ncbi:RsiW-degrading membrane proteinase PrsW (M82 family) [Nocardiopsis mwathae]|uniref:RsiW-degrading membrane proteinase PrsW (M82 family) n=1 Tax=Nocardiopsis mwathae TaxID=1472723 RepID=A0A7W9YEG4_9ACTN|nr:PrsW family intramembrane metalloprotease [Nocardiopsis mwathae]MBB6169966.1 RsiW-degrading membrane proteinase PrsW (M82 family) [Nocardiopsis mwathae]